MRRWLLAGLLLSACVVDEAPRPDRIAVEPPAPPAPPLEVASPDRIRFEVRFEAAARRRMSVRASYPTDGRSALELVMPTWIPGSYLIREFSRHVVDPVARGGAEGTRLPLIKTRKNRLRIETEGAARVELAYTLLAHDLSVRTNFVDPEYAVLNPAASFFMDPERPGRGVELVLHRPEAWPGAQAALTRLEAPPGASGFVAPDFDALVDAPVLLGDLREDRFEVAGVPHALIHVGDLRRFPFGRAGPDVEKIARAQARFWGTIPYRRYLFLNVLDQAGGGLEHRNSTLMMFSPHRALTPGGYRRWLSLVSHELFHAWNGKRLRPEVLGPFDLEREAYTRSLWWVEGMTSYYDDLLLRRAGLHTDASYLAALSRNVQRLARTPGERRQSLARSSFDAWIELYRPDEESANTAVSYYTKGALVAWVLDAEIRRLTRGRKTLDDVMRAAYRAFSGEEGYPDDALYRVFEDVAGPEARQIAEELTRSAKPLDLTPALEWFGLELAASETPSPATPTGRAKLARRTDFGAKLETTEGRLTVSSVREGGPAAVGGVAPGDELLGLDGDRVPTEGLKPLLERHLPGDRVPVLLARRGRILERVVELGLATPERSLEIDPKARRAARRRRAWLEGR